MFRVGKSSMLANTTCGFRECGGISDDASVGDAASVAWTSTLLNITRDCGVRRVTSDGADAGSVGHEGCLSGASRFNANSPPGKTSTGSGAGTTTAALHAGQRDSRPASRAGAFSALPQAHVKRSIGIAPRQFRKTTGSPCQNHAKPLFFLCVFAPLRDSHSVLSSAERVGDKDHGVSSVLKNAIS
jgi:hypothetical protein